MQLGGLSRATFSKLLQLQASPGLVSWSEMLATTTGVPLNCRLAWNFGAGVWGGESWGQQPYFVAFPSCTQCLPVCSTLVSSTRWCHCAKRQPWWLGEHPCGCWARARGVCVPALQWLALEDAARPGERPAASQSPACPNHAVGWGIALGNKTKPQTKGPTFIITHARMHPQLLNCYMQLPSKLEGNYPNSVYNLCHFIL